MTEELNERRQLRDQIIKLCKTSNLGVDDVLQSLVEALFTVVVMSAPSQSDAIDAIDKIAGTLRDSVRSYGATTRGGG